MEKDGELDKGNERAEMSVALGEDLGASGGVRGMAKEEEAKAGRDGARWALDRSRKALRPGCPARTGRKSGVSKRVLSRSFHIAGTGTWVLHTEQKPSFPCPTTGGPPACDRAGGSRVSMEAALRALDADGMEGSRAGRVSSRLICRRQISCLGYFREARRRECLMTKFFVQA